jgi:hypothetical protein
LDWTELFKSSVVAAVIAGVVASIGFFVTAATARKINGDKLKLDKQLAQERADADRALAERRVDLDYTLALLKRRAEVAEAVLIDFYKIKRAFEIIRSPMIWATEIVAEEGVADDVVGNEGYGIIRRIRQYADLFSELEARQPTFGAIFGLEATAPFGVIIQAHNRVLHAAEDLLKYRNQLDVPELRDHLVRMRREAYSNIQLDLEGAEISDPVSTAVAKAIGEIEATCRPTLEGVVRTYPSGAAAAYLPERSGPA